MLRLRYKPNPRLARAMDIMFTLHAEHEMNCSTAAARHLASSGVDVYTAIAGAHLFWLCSSQSLPLMFIGEIEEGGATLAFRAKP